MMRRCIQPCPPNSVSPPSTAIVKLLLERGARADSESGAESLARSQNPETSLALVEAGANPQADYQRLPLQKALFNGLRDVVKSILIHGADVTGDVDQVELDDFIKSYTSAMPKVWCDYPPGYGARKSSSYNAYVQRKRRLILATVANERSGRPVFEALKSEDLRPTVQIREDGKVLVTALKRTISGELQLTTATIVKSVCATDFERSFFTRD